ncbi:MAG TPA: NUDIX domain-containing protein [Anaerolineales bacterium]|nr:NUDIX domain-containing protein [Anaerolineales bacterium]
MSQKPQVGTAILISRDNKVLLMKRKGPHGAGTWSPPGGHLDFGESLEGCAAREAREEVGVDVVDIRFRSVTNDIFEEEGKHYITIWLEGKPTGEPFITAENEVEEIGWFAWDELPHPFFLPLENLVKENSYPPK